MLESEVYYFVSKFQKYLEIFEGLKNVMIIQVQVKLYPDDLSAFAKSAAVLIQREEYHIYKAKNVFQSCSNSKNPLVNNWTFSN